MKNGAFQKSSKFDFPKVLFNARIKMRVVIYKKGRIKKREELLESFTVDDFPKVSLNARIKNQNCDFKKRFE